MNRKIVFTHHGHPHQILGMKIYNFLPNQNIQSIGHFVFLDYNPDTFYKPKAPNIPDGSFAHPHRGIATFTYVTSGEFEHYDSAGHHGIVAEGGAQWMKAGDGIIHDENFSQAFQKAGGLGGSLQFWINLPAAVKKEKPEYMAFQPNDFEKIMLDDESGFLKILIGTFHWKTSKVKTYSTQFMYHLQLNPCKTFVLTTNSMLEIAAFIFAGKLTVNSTEFPKGNLIVFGEEGNEISFENNTDKVSDILVFGGEHYHEPIVAQGPFVMNTDEEITAAYNDFYSGKYGVVTHSKGKQIYEE